MCEVDIRVSEVNMDVIVCTVGVRFAYGGLDSRLELKLGGMRDRALWLVLDGVQSQVRESGPGSGRNQVRGVRSAVLGVRVRSGRGFQALHNRGSWVQGIGSQI